MTSAARQLVLPPADRAELLEDAADVIALLLTELLTFKAQSSPHKALRSIYSRRGVCETSRHGCAEPCRAWHEALETAAGWLAAYEREVER
jgi:hypothetical protein